MNSIRHTDCTNLLRKFFSQRALSGEHQARVERGRQLGKGSHEYVEALDGIKATYPQNDRRFRCNPPPQRAALDGRSRLNSRRIDPAAYEPQAIARNLGPLR